MLQEVVMSGAVTIGFVGGGNMAEAVLKGLVGKGHAPQQLIVGEPVADRRDYLAKQYQVEVTDSNLEVVAKSDVIVLAIKPQMVEAVVPGFAAVFDDSKLLISILAGTSTGALRRCPCLGKQSGGCS
jgi:pyrroline-5-carboxylate reductase